MMNNRDGAKRTMKMLHLFLMSLYSERVINDMDNLQPKGVDYTMILPADRYRETVKHNRKAVAEGESVACTTIDREGAEKTGKNR